MTNKSYFDHEKIAWQAPEYLQYRKGRTWKLGLALATVLMAAVGYYFLSWTFSLAIITFAFVYTYLDKRDPQILDVVISDLGIKVGKKEYSYSKIDGFWIIYNPPYVSTLTIRVKGNALTDVDIQLVSQNPSEIRDFLIEKIPEYEGKEESFTDILLSLLRI